MITYDRQGVVMVHSQYAVSSIDSYAYFSDNHLQGSLIQPKVLLL